MPCTQDDDAAHVSVYAFLDLTEEGLPSVATFKATRAAIVEQLGGVVLESTGERVERRALDPDGHYRRKATGWTEASLAALVPAPTDSGGVPLGPDVG